MGNEIIPNYLLQNLYALCDLGMSIVKRLASKQDDLDDLSASVALPSGLYKQLAKRDENDTPVCMPNFLDIYISLVSILIRQ